MYRVTVAPTTVTDPEGPKMVVDLRKADGKYERVFHNLHGLDTEGELLLEGLQTAIAYHRSR